MNAIVGLCHFCENHGPSLIFCTQVVHREGLSLLHDGVMTLSGDPTHEEHTHNQRNSAHNEAKSRDPGDHQARSVAVSAKPNTDSPSDDPSLSDRTRPCVVPSSLTDQLKECSLNMGEPPANAAKSEVKCEACRSLGPGLSGYSSKDTEAGVSYISGQHPQNHQVFSMVRQACVRSLSSEISPGRDGPGPIFFGDDTCGYTLSHTFILKDSQYSRGFQRRYGIIIVMMDKIYLLNSWPFLVKHTRGIILELRAKAIKVYDAEQEGNPARCQRVTPGRYAPQVRTMTPTKTARSLMELTGDAHIFRKLHQSFTWLLKVGGNRLTEKLLEGPPTEDSIIDIEKQEETEEGFVLLTSMKDTTDEQMDDGLSVASDDTDLDDDCPTFRNLRHLLKVLGYSQFHKIAHHVVVGNQVIVRGRRRRIIKSVIDCLKMLLPKGCCKVLYYCNKHEDAWRCNFLGLTLHTELPSHIEHYIMITIHDPCPSDGEGEVEVEDAVLSLQDQLFGGYVFTVESPTSLPEKGPVVLGRMEYALMNDNLADSVVDQCLLCLKDEWLNKVKVLFKFTKAGGSRSDDDTRELMRIVGAQPEDKVVLQFWRTGLSVQYRHNMLSSAINKS